MIWNIICAQVIFSLLISCVYKTYLNESLYKYLFGEEKNESNSFSTLKSTYVPILVKKLDERSYIKVDFNLEEKFDSFYLLL